MLHFLQPSLLVKDNMFNFSTRTVQIFCSAAPENNSTYWDSVCNWKAIRDPTLEMIKRLLLEHFLVFFHQHLGNEKRSKWDNLGSTQLLDMHPSPQKGGKQKKFQAQTQFLHEHFAHLQYGYMEHRKTPDPTVDKPWLSSSDRMNPSSQVMHARFCNWQSLG